MQQILHQMFYYAQCETKNHASFFKNHVASTNSPRVLHTFCLLDFCHKSSHQANTCQL